MFNPDKLIAPEPKGYRDVYWCNLLNEPVIVTYNSSGDCVCPHCNMNDADEGKAFHAIHPFLFHIRKPDG